MGGGGFDIAGRRALVTGASGGLGLHFAEVLARAGAKVTLAARRLEVLEAEATRLRAEGADASTMELDVADTGSIAAALDRAGPFDIVVNNAGISKAARALEIGEVDWDAVVDVNLKGAFFVAQAAAASMVTAGKGGSIVNVASILGLRVAGQVASYTASKAALVQLTKALALEWARHGIRVNALCPGYVETDLNREFFAGEAGQSLIRRIPQRRLGQASDLDGPLLLLASDAGAYMTGSVVAVDGGHLVSSL
jgi:NAD(P)-dependent dehydrogenase (short-subunit alcohol dehydrogenase family)